MLDGADAGFEAVLDGPRSVRVGEHVGADRAGDVNRRGQLVDRELHVVELVSRRGGAAARHHLDLVGAAPKRLPGSPPNFVSTVGEDGFGGQAVHRSEEVAGRTRPLVVAVATGLREKGPADEDSGPADQSQADRFLEPPIETAGVADRREARLQRVFDLAGDAQRDHRRGERHLLNRIEVEAGKVDMGIEQPGHQGPALTVDHLGVPGTGGPIRGSDSPDPSLLDHDSRVGLWIAAGAVEQGRVFEDDAQGLTSLSTPRCRSGRGRCYRRARTQAANPMPSPPVNSSGGRSGTFR